MHNQLYIVSVVRYIVQGAPSFTSFIAHLGVINSVIASEGGSDRPDRRASGSEYW
jgi:hypothetical protein